MPHILQPKISGSLFKMSNWKPILKRGASTITQEQKDIIDTVMRDGTAKTIKQILNEIWNHIESERRNNTRSVRWGYWLVPTRTQIQYYLNVNDEYESYGISRATGNRVTSLVGDKVQRFYQRVV